MYRNRTRRSSRGNTPYYKSTCLGETYRGTAKQLVDKYTSLAAEDELNKEHYNQHAEYFRRLDDGSHCNRANTEEGKTR